jgi:predicted nucleotidyltransferase
VPKIYYIITFKFFESDKNICKNVEVKNSIRLSLARNTRQNLFLKSNQHQYFSKFVRNFKDSKYVVILLVTAVVE